MKAKINNKIEEVEVIGSSFNETTQVLSVHVRKITPIDKIIITIKLPK